jgi:site-specific DNA recombinase
VIYLRVSTREQAEHGEGEEGYSIPAQREACVRHLRDQGWDLVDEYVDRGESARSADRPELKAMLGRIAEDGDVDAVVVHKIDRLARNMEDHVAIRALLRRRGAILVSVTENLEETASGRLVEGIHALMAEFYSANLASEIKKGMSQKAKLGGWPHAAPLGYVNVRETIGGRQVAHIVVDPDRAPHITAAFEVYATGEWTLERLVEELDHRGLRNRSRRDRATAPIGVSALAAILANKVYAGIVSWEGIDYPGLHEPLIDTSTFNRVQELLAGRAARGTRERRHNHYLKGTLFCGVCGRGLSFQMAKGRYEYLYCLGQKNRNPTGCREPYVPAGDLEAQVEQLYERIQLPESWLESLRVDVDAEIASRQRRNAAERQVVTRQLAKTETERRKLLDAYYASAIDVTTLKAEQARIADDVRAAQVRLASIDAHLAEWQEILETAMRFATNCAKAYARASDPTRRRLNQAVFSRIAVRDSKIVDVGYHPPFDLLFSSSKFEYGDLVEMTGLEPVTPCLQIPPSRTAMNDGEPSWLVGDTVRSTANGSERRRPCPIRAMYVRCAAPLRSRSAGGLMNGAPVSMSRELAGKLPPKEQVRGGGRLNHVDTVRPRNSGLDSPPCFHEAAVRGRPWSPPYRGGHSVTATISILGPLEIDRRPAVLRSKGARGLIELMALRTGRTVSISAITEALWGDDPPATSRKGVQVHVSALRKVVGQETIETVGQGYRLRIPPEAIDASCFEELANEGRRCLVADLPGEALAFLDQAIELWRDEPIPDLTDAEIGQAMAARLREIRLNAEEDRFEAALALGEHSSLVPELQHAVAVEPLRENRWAQLMLALYRTGRQADALRTYQDLHKSLVELGIGPSPKIANLEKAIALNSPELDWEPRSAPPTSRRRGPDMPSSLPVPATRLIGRLDELAAADVYLAQSRLLTLTGAGGSGKTRLAIEAGRRRCSLHRDGVFFVDLATLSTTSANAVAGFIAQAIGLADEESPHAEWTTESLGRALVPLDALVLLDNCEHVLSSCAEVVAGLLRLCPRLTILATSRAALGIDGEQRFLVPSLSVPPENAALARDLIGCESVERFIDRTRSCGTQITVTNANARVLTSLTRRLDGLPLALELAAARTPSLSITRIERRLGERFRLLEQGRRGGPQRQRTLWATIDWSYRLLSGSEQAMLRRLSIFSGGFSPEAARGVCAFAELTPGMVDDLLTSLVDHSLIEVKFVLGDLRYQMLEMIREFGAEQLDPNGTVAVHQRRERACLVDRYINYYVEMTGGGPFLMHGDGDLLRNARRELDRDNVRSVLERVMADLERGADLVRLVVGARPWWFFHRAETAGWVRAALEVAANAIPKSLRTEFLSFAAEVLVRSDVHGAARLADESLRLAAEIGDPRLEARAHYAQAKIATVGWDLAGMETIAHLVAMVRGLDDRPLLAECLNLAALMAVSTAPSQAHRYIEELLEIADREKFTSQSWDAQLYVSRYEQILGNNQAALDAIRRYLDTADTLGPGAERFSVRTTPLLSKGFIEIDMGDVALAAESFAEALWLAHRQLILSEMSYAALGLAMCANAVGDVSRARSLLEFADRQMAELGQSWHRPMQKRRERLLGELRPVTRTMPHDPGDVDVETDPADVVDLVLDWDLVQKGSAGPAK